jgi:hypothetical protein
MPRLADKLPVVRGVNVTLIWHVPFATRLLQVLVSANEEAAGPEIVIPVTDNDAVLVFMTAIVCAVLGVDTN